MGVTLSQLESYRPSGVKLPPEQEIATHCKLLHSGAAESVQSSEEEHVVTAVFVAAATLPDVLLAAEMVKLKPRETTAC